MAANPLNSQDPDSNLLIAWLLDSDPAIRWQVLRDLLHAPAEVVAAERARVLAEGWGARLLARQGADGQWDGGALFPLWYREAGPEEWGKPGQPWTATAPTLVLLQDFGIDPTAVVTATAPPPNRGRKLS